MLTTNSLHPTFAACRDGIMLPSRAVNSTSSGVAWSVATSWFTTALCRIATTFLPSLIEKPISQSNKRSQVLPIRTLPRQTLPNSFFPSILIVHSNATIASLNKGDGHGPVA